MRRVRLPGTYIECSELGLGTWGLGGPNNIGGYALGWPSVDRPHRVVEEAVAQGITLFDCSNFYGLGRAEEILGETLEGHTDLVVVTKAGLLPRLVPGTSDIERSFLRTDLLRSVEQSLKRLRRDRLDVLLLHGPEGALRPETLNALEELQRAGAIRHWGVALGRTEGTPPPLLKWLDLPSLSIVLLEYSLRYPSRAAGIDSLYTRQKTIIGRSILNHGLLTREDLPTQPMSPEDHRRQKSAGEALKVSAFRDAHAVCGFARSPLESAFRYALDSPALSAIVVGARKPEQVRALAALAERPALSEVERAQLQYIARRAFAD